MSAPVASLVILSQPSCVQCGSTYRALDKRGIPYRSFDVSNEEDLAAGGQEHHDKAKERGYMQAPSASPWRRTERSWTTCQAFARTRSRSRNWPSRQPSPAPS